MALCLFSNALFAQSQSVSGYIYDSQTGLPLPGVTIKTQDNVALTQSDRSGYFKTTVIPPANTVKAVLIGYKTQSVTLGPETNTLNIQLQADAVNLNEVRVTGFDGNKTRKETAGSVALLTLQDLSKGSTLSLQSALNAVPGVRMDQSTLSEARISIRGNGVRASYGIRNIKIYVNDIPVTEADGTTRIEALDVNSIGRAEIIKGPASSIYGAGTGGVINFQLQRSPYQEKSLEASGLVGAYGLHRLATTFRSGGDKMNSYVSYGWQEYNGYREHSNDMRRFITGNFQLFPSEKQQITLLLNRTTQYSQIPGSLTAAQVAEDPLQANASNLDKAAGRYQTWTRIGIGQQYQFNSKFSNSTSVFTYFYDLNHPLPYAYLHNYYQSYGGRTRFMYNPGFSHLPTRFTIGAEFNNGLTKGTQYVNNHGTEGAPNAIVDYDNTAYAIFYQSETNLDARTVLTVGVSYSGLKYDVDNYLNREQSGIKKFKPQASPRIALSHDFGSFLSLHASVSSGFSPPSSSEIKNVDGLINPAIQPEKGINYELDAKGNLFNSRLSYDLALFRLDMKGELIAQSVQQSITIYNNAGKTRHDGVELALSYQAIKPDEHLFVTILRPYAAVTYSDFRFTDYKILDAQNNVTASYGGNKLTGISPWVLSAGIDVETHPGLYLYGTYLYNSRLPLNDANTAFNPEYHVLNAKLGYKKQLGKAFELNLYGGIDNILNRAYSSIVSLNAVGYGGAQPAYFNPSPKRNGYAGVGIKYLF
ncbi:TonB-dependent receptor [Pedobacter sp. BS3]|uniref:TonB-dependent receptor n=1 Tax=Pedobacter sp. BS3 TaxID=2567937 RepID=UPI001658DF7E|nr:TonB-dependent receptor [Pedobacter sp. BS3]